MINSVFLYFRILCVRKVYNILLRQGCKANCKLHLALVLHALT